MQRLVIIALIILAIIYGAGLLIPITIAALLTILIAAVAEKIEFAGLPRSISLMLSIALFTALLSVIPLAVTEQVDTIKQVWPRYVERFSELMAQASNWLGPQISKRVNETIENLDLTRSIPSLVGSAGSFLSSFILVILLTAFMLAERGTLTQKVQKIFSHNEDKGERVLDALERTGSGIRDYLWIKTIMSALTAVFSYVLFKLLGINFAETWAIVIFFLNYIPNVGSVLGAVFPAVLALIQFDTLWQFFVIVISLSIAEFFIGNVLEPRIMGRTLNLSPFVVICSLLFWSATWGIVGAFVGVPLTAAIAILCSKLPDWRWLAIVLSEDGTVDV